MKNGRGCGNVGDSAGKSIVEIRHVSFHRLFSIVHQVRIDRHICDKDARVRISSKLAVSISSVVNALSLWDDVRESSTKFSGKS
jgi:hypothetical protein